MKKYFLFVLFLSTSFINNINAQVFTGNLKITSQAQVDAFNYTTVTGNLEIYDFDDGVFDITNLNGLSELTSIGGSLYIHGNELLNDIAGLSNLISIESELRFKSNLALTDINGLNNLTSIGGEFNIVASSAFINISGLNGLRSVGGNFSVQETNTLIHIDGLKNLTTIGGFFDLEKNTALTDINGFSSLNSIGEYFDIIGNTALTHLGINNLQTIGGYLHFAGNSALTDIDGLNGLKSVGEYLEIKTNLSLINVSGLNGLTTIGKYLYVTNNKLINIDGLKNLTSVSEFVDIKDNSDLTDIYGLSNLNFIGGYFYIEGSPQLNDINGLNDLTTIGGNFYLTGTLVPSINLNKLQTVGGDFHIAGNDSLKNIELKSLNSVGGYLYLKGNRTLNKIDGFQNLTSIGDFFGLNGNTKLTYVKQLSHLTTVGEIFIDHNESLKTIGLSNLKSVINNLKITDNASLVNLDELFRLETVGKDLTIKDNENLSGYCGLYTLLSNNGLTGDYSISGNLINPTEQEIINDGPCIPIADAGVDQIVIEGEIVQLDGSASISYNGSLTFKWTFISKPSGSNSVLSDNFIVNPIFKTNERGIYALQLIVNDGHSDSEPDTVIITALSIPEALQNPISEVKSLPLRNGNKNSLLTKLNNAIKKYNQGNISTLINELEAFLNQLNAFVNGGKLSPEEAQPIFDYVNRIIAATNSLLSKSVVQNTASEIPKEYSLNQNYPNPFNPSTTINWQLPASSHVSLKIYDIIGNEVATLINEEKEAGYYQIKFNASNLASGVYLYCLKAGDYLSAKKMILLK